MSFNTAKLQPFLEIRATLSKNVSPSPVALKDQADDAKPYAINCKIKPFGPISQKPIPKNASLGTKNTLLIYFKGLPRVSFPVFLYLCGRFCANCAQVTVNKDYINTTTINTRKNYGFKNHCSGQASARHPQRG